MTRQKGIVLLTTIMMLALLAMLVLSEMQGIFLYHKALNHLLEKHQSLYQLEAQANILALNDWSMKRNCVIKEQNPNKIIGLLKSRQACSLIHEKQQFFYLVEELGLFPCLQTMVNKITYSTRHLRINLLKTGTKSAFLQLRVANLVPLASCENSSPTSIKAGLVSWRYLIKTAMED